MDRPLMPKATAVWLVENTALTFEQIAAFCGLHPLEVKGIADGEVATGVRGLDPIISGALTREEIRRCERQDRPDAIAWLLRNHPEVTDQSICKLLGTTKTTVQSVRERTHWKSQDIRPRDPVILGLCSQGELDEVIARARVERDAPKEPGRHSPGEADAHG